MQDRYSEIFNQVTEAIAANADGNDEVLTYARLSRPRIEDVLREIDQHGLEGKQVCEIGFGPIGLGCKIGLGADIHAYDYGDTYAPVCEKFDIPHFHLDLRGDIATPTEQYDLIIFCEVIEHIDRPPAEILEALRKWLKPGGTLLLSTVNLVRLSNRIRLAAGKEIFDRYSPENLIMGHHREYVLEELESYIKSSGFTCARLYYYSLPDSRYSKLVQAAYMGLTKLFPKLSNVMYIWAENPK